MEIKIIIASSQHYSRRSCHWKKAKESYKKQEVEERKLSLFVENTVRLYR